MTQTLLQLAPVCLLMSHIVNATGECAMDKDGQAPQDMAKVRADVPTPDRRPPVLETGRADRTIKDALEDDEVREALGLHRWTKRP